MNKKTIGIVLIVAAIIVAAKHYVCTGTIIDPTSADTALILLFLGIGIPLYLRG